jgi:hypothetical protein
MFLALSQATLAITAQIANPRKSLGAIGAVIAIALGRKNVL